MKTFGITAALIGFGMSSVAMAQAQPGVVGMVQAVRAAEAQTGGGAFEAELEREGKKSFYEIDIAKGKSLHKVKVDAATGTIISSTRPRVANMMPGWASDDVPSNPKRIGSMLEAIERETNGKIQEVGFDVEKGSEIYEIEVATAKGIAELHIDAATGKRMPIRYDD